VHAVVLEQVPYRHVVFTVPKVLRRAFLRDRKLLLELSRCAWTTLCRGLSMAVGDRHVRPGAVLARATAGDLANGHPHLHAIVSCGVWTDSGRGEGFLPWPAHLDGSHLEALFRRRVLALLVRRERLAKSTADRIMQWSPTGFSVWLGDPIYPHEVESRLRLARYLVKPAIALNRMEYDPKTCLVRYTSTAQRRSRTLTALDFMAELVVHINDPRDHTVSYLGRCSNRSRGMRRKAASVQGCTPSPAPPMPSRQAFRRSWAQLLKQVWSVDVTVCPRCGGNVRIRCAILKPRSIKRLLDHLGIPSPRPPNPHDCPPAPGYQLLLPVGLPVATPSPSVTPVHPDDASDPHLNDDWPVDAPFAEE
jgi:hypothetical protein